jgi:cyanophycin synthetase
MVEAAVFENGSKAILSEGLAYDWCQVGVVTKIDPADTLPEFYIDDAEQMVKVARTQVDIVLPTGVAVLNAADERVAQLASLCDGSVIFFAVSPDAPAIIAHRAEGGRSVFVRKGKIVLATGKDENLIGAFSTRKQPSLDTENVLAAIAAAWALGVSSDLMRAGIETFE